MVDLHRSEERPDPRPLGADSTGAAKADKVVDLLRGLSTYRQFSIREIAERCRSRDPAATPKALSCASRVARQNVEEL